MTRKTRYFVTAALAALLVGLGGGLVAYLTYSRAAALPEGLPPEVRYVPLDAEVIAYADVKAVFSSELHRQLKPSIESGSRRGRRMMNEFAGVDLEKQVNYVLAYIEPPAAGEPPASDPRVPRALMFVQGSFEQSGIEQFIRDHGGQLESHGGRKIFVHREDGEETAVGFARPDLLAIGQADLVRRALDRVDTTGTAQDVTSNAELMNLIRASLGSTAWVVGRYDAVRRRMKLPSEVTGQVPPLHLVSAKADINGGIKATIRAETGSKAAADQLRDVVRGFIAMARLSGAAKPELETTLKSIEVSGTDNTVQLSFAVPAEALGTLAPRK